MARITSRLIVDGALPLQPAISPDGRWVAYTVSTLGRPEDRQRSAIWIAATDASSPPRKLTAGAAKDFLPRWAPDSASLYFGSDRVERGTVQLHRISADGGEAETLTTRPGGISDHLPLAGHGLVAVVAEDAPACEDVRVWGEHVPYGRLWLLDPDTGRLGKVEGLDDRHVAELAQCPDAGPLAVLSWAVPDLDPGCSTCALHVVDPETGTVRDLGDVEPAASSPVWWRTDGVWHLCYLATTPPGPVGGRAVFDVTVPAAGAAADRRNLTAGMAVCPAGLAQVAHGPPLALFADGLDTAIHRLDPATGRFQRMSRVAGLAVSLTASHSGEVVAALVSSAYEPMNVHAGPPAARLTRLSDTRPELRGLRWGTQERLSYRAADGLDLDGLLILPVGASRHDGPFPLVTLVHGGPYARYADQFMLGVFPSGQWLAAAGYAVFLPNPRGGEGHGHAFAASVAGAVGMDEWTDIVTGIDVLIEDGVADPDRLGIGGWSHGGFMAAWAVGRTTRFKAAVMGAGICEGAGPHRHDELSPVSYASEIRTPVLILHGEDDTNVPLGQSTYFHRALRRFGVEHEFVVYPREGHAIRERGHQLDVLERTRAWFDRWLAGPAWRSPC
ncbi:S9 family peptidase [Nonomuraea aridisoli]|uniref:Dipeptidyl aminopeptidase n=1 Tax=Nonomuraea aridisoli TaxID=2070368 RepID=A0A2W2EK47_9ACTN|nr:prolyl oligopeptidase family serine peptidase [Nonomuraea aridisoli]PZG17115.1 dipeptidyl aminopeptidase [Nonomuraea aridisoli]